MKLTPLDIRKQEFKKTMRGYDTDEVEAFLTMVSDEMEMLIREKNQSNDELIKLRTQLKDYQRVEQTLRDTLVRAQNTVEDTRANSRREAEIIIHEAELKGEDITKEAREDLLRLRNEMSIVRAQKESFSKRLRHLLESQIELLEVLEMGDNNEFDTGHRREHNPKKHTGYENSQSSNEELNKRQQNRTPIIKENEQRIERYNTDQDEQTAEDFIV